MRLAVVEEGELEADGMRGKIGQRTPDIDGRVVHDPDVGARHHPQAGDTRHAQNLRPPSGCGARRVGGVGGHARAPAPVNSSSRRAT